MTQAFEASSVARHKTLVIMPAWNEAEVIGTTVREVFEYGPACDVLVIDDGSRDSTAALASAAGARVLQLPFNMGVGGAMRTGFKYAKTHGYSQVIQVDADGQHDPRDIKAVLDGLREADIAIGARFADKGTYSVRGPRKWAMSVLAWSHFPHCRHATDGCHVRFPRCQRKGDPAVCRPLPGRIPWRYH